MTFWDFWDNHPSESNNLASVVMLQLVGAVWWIGLCLSKIGSTTEINNYMNSEEEE